MSTDRGQAHTLEAVTAATILLAALVFASQAAAVTPLTASTSSQHIENQERASVDGMLAGARANGTVRSAVTLVNNSTGLYYGTSLVDPTYSNGGPPAAFGATLNQTWRDEGIAFNVDVYYIQLAGGEQSRARRSVVYMGEPTDSSVSASTVVTLYDDDRLHEPNGSTAAPTNVTLNETTWDDDGDGESDDVFYVSDVYDGPAFNVVEVEVTVWRM
ncbi:MAG: hypothetical protein ABEJ61_08125 [Haloferacaceae archaeon]